MIAWLLCLIVSLIVLPLLPIFLFIITPIWVLRAFICWVWGMGEESHEEFMARMREKYL